LGTELLNNAPRPGFSLSYTPALDGIRGVSILAVMIYHAGASFLPGGFIGVDVFFVLSGFLITALLLKEYDRGRQIQLKKLYIRRVLRLAPALAVLLFVFTVSSWLLLEPKQAGSHLWDAFITLCYASNWTQALDIHPPDLLGHTWSLSIEEQFYILWPMTLCLL
jgi:peptidoglycan/LPS O-acetylase OafA/YrhL